MLKIKMRTIRKRVTLEEFMRLKKDGPNVEHYNEALIAENAKRVADGLAPKVLRPSFEDMRQNAKAINFAFLFGATGATFARNTLETAWDEATCDAYIRDNNLRSLKEQIVQRYARESPLMWKVITCATDIRNKFFKTYPGLQERIEREKKFAMDHGYVRAWHGAARRIPELFLMEKGEGGGVKGDDRTLYGAMIGNLSNIAANTAIQNLEAVIVMSAITALQNYMEEKGLKSYIFGSVHDSIDLCIHKDELEEVCLKIRELCAPALEHLPDMWQGMPQDVDMVVGDIKQGHYYKGGKPWKAFLNKKPA